MSPRQAASVDLEPLVGWPRRATQGVEHLVTVDLRLAQPPGDWPYDEEEFSFICVLDGGRNFSVESVDDITVILHRFGGTYGPARFIITSTAEPGRHSLWLTITTERGAVLRTDELVVDVEEPGAETRASQPSVSIAGRITQGTARSDRPGTKPSAEAARLARKVRLATEAERLATSSDWDKAEAAYRELLTQWNEAGPAERAAEERLWARFSAARHAFRTARSAHLAERDAQLRENTEARERLLAEAERLSSVADVRDAQRALRALKAQWDSLGPLMSDSQHRLARRFRSVEDAMADRVSSLPPSAPRLVEIDPRAPLFYLSYARSTGATGANAGDRHVTSFFDDLSANVAELVSRRTGADPGFMDRTITAGRRRSQDVMEAIGTCQVFIPLLSANYLTSEWCAREWHAFSQRTVSTIRPSTSDTGGTSCIIPVLWAPVREAEIPRPVQAVQRFAPTNVPLTETATMYQTEGVRGLQVLGSADYYHAVVWRLAQRVADLIYRYHVEPRTFDPAELRNIFRE